MNLNQYSNFVFTLHEFWFFPYNLGLQSKYSGSASNLCDSTKLSVYINGPAGIHVFVTDEVLSNIKDESLFTMEVQNNKVLMKIVYKNEIWDLDTYREILCELITTL